jgi:hypothetical protein
LPTYLLSLVGVFFKTVGIAMCTNCSPLLTDLFLYSHEAIFIQGLLKKNEKKLARSFNFTFCYIDNVLSLNNYRFGGQPSHAGDRKAFEVITSTKPRRTLGSVASLLAATLYQGNPDRNHKLWNIRSNERYILHMQVLLECCYI